MLKIYDTLQDALDAGYRLPDLERDIDTTYNAFSSTKLSSFQNIKGFEYTNKEGETTVLVFILHSASRSSHFQLMYPPKGDTSKGV